MHLYLAMIAGVAPVCTAASHERLVVQPGRDVCAASVDAHGTPRAPGFLPTSCPRPNQSYRVDARGNADLCVETRPGGEQ